MSTRYIAVLIVIATLAIAAACSSPPPTHAYPEAEVIGLAKQWANDNYVDECLAPGLFIWSAEPSFTPGTWGVELDWNTSTKQADSTGEYSMGQITVHESTNVVTEDTRAYIQQCFNPYDQKMPCDWPDGSIVVRTLDCKDGFD